jgi:hypothetical protein
VNDSTTFVRLLGSVRDHLSAFRPAAPLAHVSVGSNVLDGDHVAVQLQSCGLVAVAAGLLEWTRTLSSVAATAWRPQNSTLVHLTVAGLLSDGTPVHVYGGVTHDDVLFGDLQPGGRHSVALTVLRGWAVDSPAVAA